MARIYRTTDRISLSVDDLTIVISPLSVHQKALVEEAAKGGGTSNLLKASLEAVRYSLKDIRGVVDSDDKEYTLEFNPDGSLTDQCLDDIFNIQESTKLISIALNLVNGVPEKFYDLSTGNPLEGVSFVESKEKPKSRKK